MCSTPRKNFFFVLQLVSVQKKRGTRFVDDTLEGVFLGAHLRTAAPPHGLCIPVEHAVPHVTDFAFCVSVAV